MRIWLLLIAACHYTPPGSAPGPDPADDDPVGPDAAPAPETATCNVGGTALCIEFENGADEYDAMDVALDGSGNTRDALASNVVSTRRRVLPTVPDDRSAGLGLTSSLTVGNDLGIDQSFTVEIWVQRASSHLVTRNWLIDSNGRFFVSIADTTGSIRCGVNFAGVDDQTQRIDTLLTTVDFDWHHVACTFDHTSKLVTVYVDGSSKDCGVLARPITPAAGPTTIGLPHSGARSTDHLFGSVDSLRVYDHALAAGDICTLWGGGACQVQCNPNGGQNAPPNGH